MESVLFEVVGEEVVIIDKVDLGIEIEIVIDLGFVDVQIDLYFLLFLVFFDIGDLIQVLFFLDFIDEIIFGKDQGKEIFIEKEIQ